MTVNALETVSLNVKLKVGTQFHTTALNIPITDLAHRTQIKRLDHSAA